MGKRERLPWDGNGRKECEKCGAKSVASVIPGLCLYHFYLAFFGADSAVESFPDHPDATGDLKRERQWEELMNG
jgi:hypothetical protein